MILNASVGKAGKNQRADVVLVQRLLNDSRLRRGLPSLKVDGTCNSKTLEAIVEYQSKKGLTPATGAVDPRSKTLRSLFDDAIAGISEGLTELPKIPGAKLADPGLTDVDALTVARIFEQFKA